MRYYYICNDCLKEAAACDIKDIPVDEYHYICSLLVIEVSHAPNQAVDLKCETCGGTNLKKLLTPPLSYTKGYGYLDKAGTTNDRDLYLMTENQDPYKSSRKPGDKQEIIRKLRKNKEFNPKTKVTHMSTKTSKKA
jgi:hypothetical protein